MNKDKLVWLVDWREDVLNSDGFAILTENQACLSVGGEQQD